MKFDITDLLITIKVNPLILLVLFLSFNYFIITQTKIYEANQSYSNQFLKIKPTLEALTEQVKETLETKRESCLYEYQQQQQQKSYRRRKILPSYCARYCTETTDCELEDEQLICTDPAYPSWPSRVLKFIVKFQRMCYVRITEILHYEQAQDMCQRHGFELAIIDNIPLLEQLTEMHMFNATCKGQCPEARGFYIGLKRHMDGTNNSSSMQWIWSNNVTWTQNETECDDEYFETSFGNGSLLCYIGVDGQKKVTVWNVGEPNNLQQNQVQTNEQCVEIIGRPDRTGSLEQIGKLNDISCTKLALGAICQIQDVKPTNSTRFRNFVHYFGYNITEYEIYDPVQSLLESFDNSFMHTLHSMSIVTEALEKLLVLPSFNIIQATNILSIVDRIIATTEQIQTENDLLKFITNRLLFFLELFLRKIRIDKNQLRTSFQLEHMKIYLMDISLNDLRQEQSTNDWFTVTFVNIDHPSNNIFQINLPMLEKHLEVADNYRIIEIVHSNFNLFPQDNITNRAHENYHSLIGTPISYQIVNWTMTQTDQDFVRFQIRINNSIQSRNISCVYWSFDIENGSWTEDNGCRFTGYIDDYAYCSCNHLAHFALLLSPDSKQIIPNISTTEELFLTFMIYLGLALCILELFVTFITYILFRYSQKNRLHISLFMLCLSLLFINCLYIPFNLTKTNSLETSKNYACTIYGVLIHYFSITSFMWMLIVTIVQYMHFVRIINAYISQFFIKSNITGWIVPLIFPILMLSIEEEGAYIGQARCWINGHVLFYATFLAPISLIALCILLLFLSILTSHCRDKSSMLTYQNNQSKIQVVAALCCFLSLGCTWFFGILVLVRPYFIFQLLFCISNTLEGLFIFLFHVYLSKPKRELWQTYFIQHGFHQSSHSFDDRTETVITANNQNISKTNTLKLSVHFGHKSKSSSTVKNSASHNENSQLQKDIASPHCASRNGILTHPDSLSDRIRKTTTNRNVYI